MIDTPTRNAQHEALDVFLGKWTARGMSYGGTDQSGDDPKANGEPWISTHEGAWHTGSFFLVQDERADIAASRFDTLNIFGVDTKTGEYFSRSFENHGFYRNYQMARVGDVWTLTGDTERATTKFADNNRTQNIVWEWKRGNLWLPLCDRIAVRVD